MGADTELKLKQILVEHLKYPLQPDSILPHTTLHGRGLGLSSIDVVALIVRLENDFDIFFEADELSAAVTTFGALLSITEQKVGARHA